MADFRGKPLPNLKISVDNTESTDESESEGEIQEEIKVPIVVIEDKEESEVEEDSDKDEVEFNVRIGSYARDRNKDRRSGSETEDRHGERDERSSYKTKSTDTLEKEKIKRPVQESALPPQKRIYENKSGTFVTGIDVTSEEAAEKRKKRAERFRIQQEEAAQQTLDLEGMYKSLGISVSDFENEEKGLRKEAIHMWGTDNMSTKDVFDYFAEFPPSAIEWINDTSCNVVWLDKVTAVRAILKHSITYDDAMAAEAKRIQAEKERKHKHKKAQDQEMKDMEKEDKTEPGGDGDSEKKSKETSDTKADKDAAADAPEKMDVDEDDDNLDLTVASNTEDVAMKEKTEGGDKAKKNEDRETGKTGDKTKKKHEKKESKKGKDDGNDSDNSTSSSSSSGNSSSGSGSGSGSSSSSSSGSGSGSDSGSGSGSSSSSGSGSSSTSSSDSEGGKDSKSKKKASKKSLSRRDGETGELSPHERRRTKRKKDQTIPWPSGKWRLGTSCQKARYLFMRFATADDKKEPGAEKKSQYYRRYGNPNYGGMKGLISQSRKRKIRMAKIDKDIKSQGPDARELIDTKRANRKRAREEEDREEGEISEDDSGGEEEESGVVVVEDDEDDVTVVNAPKMAEKPKDLRQLLDRETAQPARLTRSDSHESDDRPVVVKALGEKEDEGEEDEMDFDAELAYLMKNPPKKRMMRMHADDEEEKLKAKKRKGLLTVVAKDGAGVRSRLGGRLQQTRQDSRIYDVEDDEDDEDIFGNEHDYGDFVVRRDEDQGGQSSGGGDLRSKLSARKRTGGSDRRHYPPMRIEVFD